MVCFQLSVEQLNDVKLRYFLKLYVGRKILVYHCMFRRKRLSAFFVVVSQCFPYIQTSDFQLSPPLVVNGSAHEPGLEYERRPSFGL